MFPFQCLDQSFFCDDNAYFTYQIRSSDEQDRTEREIYFGNTRIEQYMFAVFGPTDSQTDTEDEQETNKVSQVVKKAKAKGKLREEDEGEGDVREGKGQPKGNHWRGWQKVQGFHYTLIIWANVSSWLSNFRLCNEFIFQVRGQPIHHLWLCFIWTIVRIDSSVHCWNKKKWNQYILCVLEIFWVPDLAAGGPYWVLISRKVWSVFQSLWDQRL